LEKNPIVIVFDNFLMGVAMLFLSILFAVAVAEVEVIQPEQKVEEPVEKPKILVVYYSRTGTTEKIGGLIASAVEADAEKLVDKKDRSGAWGYLVGGKDAGFENETELQELKYDPGEYDLVIIGTPIWSWNMTPAIRTYITKNKDKIKNVAFFTTSGGTSYEKVVPLMEKHLGKEALFKTGFLEKEVKNDSVEMIEKLRTLNKFIENFFSTIAL